MQTATRLITVSLMAAFLLVAVEPCEGQSVSASASSSSNGSRTRSFRTIDELLLFFPTKFPDGNW